MNTDDHIIDQNGSWSSPQEALEWYRAQLATVTAKRDALRAGNAEPDGTYLDQIAKAKADLETWPQWMKDAARLAVAKTERRTMSDTPKITNYAEFMAEAENLNPAGFSRELSESSTGTSTCIWHQDGEDSDIWQTSCHQAFTINDGDPSDNSMAYCCFCGRRLEESPWPEDEDEAGGAG